MSEITPEKVAAAVSQAVVSGWRHRLQAALSVAAEGNVLNLSVTRWEDDEEGTEVVRHFRAVVIEGETAPIVVTPEFLAAARALYCWHVSASTLAGAEYARAVYALQEALDALTPEQLAVLAGEDGGDDDA